MFVIYLVYACNGICLSASKLFDKIIDNFEKTEKSNFMSEIQTISIENQFGNCSTGKLQCH